MTDHGRAKRLERFGADFYRPWNVQFNMLHKKNANIASLTRSNCSQAATSWQEKFLRGSIPKQAHAMRA
jgi:hypothetical protein